jgi:hypothetical protein
MIDYSQKATCRDCGTERPILYMFGVRENGSGVCVECMDTHECKPGICYETSGAR